MLTIHHLGVSQSDRIVWLMEELQLPYELKWYARGPDGLAPQIDERADMRWSLSALTLPHALARVVVAEALYRAVSIIKRHPYHRA